MEYNLQLCLVYFLEIEAVAPERSLAVNIGFPMAKPNKRLTRTDLRLMKRDKDNAELERLSRLRKRKSYKMNFKVFTQKMLFNLRMGKNKKFSGKGYIIKIFSWKRIITSQSSMPEVNTEEVLMYLSEVWPVDILISTLFLRGWVTFSQNIHNYTVHDKTRTCEKTSVIAY